MCPVCDVEDCFRPAELGKRMCSAHRKHLARYGELRPVMDGDGIDRMARAVRSRLIEAAFALADADSEDDDVYDLAHVEFWSAVDAAARVGVRIVASLSPEPQRIRRR
jgi:hypothetical protein